MRPTLIIAAAAGVAVLPLLSGPAFAQANRTFVSGHGSDANPCSLGAPCRSFQAAYNATAAGGEIDVLDPGGYGAISITKAISIQAHGFAGITAPSGGTAITINAGASDAVSLNGLLIEGAGVGATGILFSAGGSLTIANTVVRNFTGSGIGIAPTMSAAIAISSTLVADNGAHGIYVQPSGLSIRVGTVILTRVEAYHNAQKGIAIFGNAISLPSSVEALADDCVSAHNDVGYYALGNGGLSAVLRVYRSAGSDNATGVLADGGADVVVSQSNLDGNAATWTQANLGNVFSYGDNYTGGAPAPSGTITKN